MDCCRRDLTGLSAGLDGLTSIRGDVDVRGTVKIVSFPTTRKTTTLADAIFVHIPHELWRLSRNSNSILAWRSDFRKARSQTSPRSAWIRASPIRSHCEAGPARRDLRGVISPATHGALHLNCVIPNRKPSESKARRRSKTANKGNWPSA